IWRLAADGMPSRLAGFGEVSAALPRALELVHAAVTDSARRELAIDTEPALPPALSRVATEPLGRPAFAVLQLFYSPDAAPAESELQPLSAFAARAAHALRSGDHARSVEQELVRTRSLFEVVSEAVSRLSLDHTLETAVERTSELLQIDAIGIYLVDKEHLLAAAGRGVAGGHEEVAQRASDAFLGPLRARSSLQV